MYIKHDEHGYILIISDTPMPDGLPDPVELPSDFNRQLQYCYRYDDGQITFDPGKLEKELEAEKLQNEESNRRNDAADVASIVFVQLAQDGRFDDSTIAEHSMQFSAWNELWRGKAGTIVQDEGELYRSIHDINDSGQNRKPSQSPSMWTKIGNPDEEYPEWSPPIGAHDAYHLGAKVTYNGKRWVCTGASAGGTNDWQPGVYGWTEVT